MFRFERKEIYVLVTMMLGLILLINLPYYVGYATQDEQMKFRGAIVDRSDYAVHISSMQSGSNGEWQYRFRFSSEDIPGAYVKMTYILLGHIADILNIPVKSFYHLLLNLFFILMYLVVYLVMVIIFPSSSHRLLALWLTIATSGMGVLQLLVGFIPNEQISPIDLWFMDGYIFFGSMIFPHFSISMTCLVGTFGLILSLERNAHIWKWLILVGLSVVSSLNQPFITILQGILIVAGCVYLILNRSKDARRILIGTICVLFIIGVGLGYNLLVLFTYPYWKIYTFQNITLSPSLEYYF